MSTHKIICANSRHMVDIQDKSVHLIITSPPYPMIEMWDEMFGAQNPDITNYLKNSEGLKAFYAMHEQLNDVWRECDRVLADNCFICINIGDATRTINGVFQLFSNHTQIINFFLDKGYSVLPDIHWRKQSNAPNKFMGSGMYPAGAYVTYEHEYILIFRKGGKREFKDEAKKLRQKSAYFWEERNVWFSDLWDIKGTTQTISKTDKTRKRNASFPIEIPYRLVNMYSVEGDTVLDPFVGLGTTNLACMASNRNSIGIDIVPEIVDLALKNPNMTASSLNTIIDARIQQHINFINALPEEKKKKCYKNSSHDFLVKTKQETEIKIDRVSYVLPTDNTITCLYEKDSSLF